MYWWQKSAVGNNPSHSLSDDEYSVADSDDLGSKSSIFGRAFAFRSPNRFRTSRSRRINSPRSSSFDTISNSVNNLPRSRSDGSVMAPQPLPLPELAVLLRQDAVASPSNSNATVRLPSPKKNKDAPAPPHSSKCREERDISDAHRHGNGDAVTSMSGFSSKNVNQGARRNSEHAAETLASRRSSGRPYGAEKTRSYKLNVPVNMPISSFSSPSLSPGRNSCDILTSHHMSPPGFQAWSAPELPPSDIILGSGQYNQPYEITAISADNSPLHNQKINYAQNAISSYGPISPLHRKFTETSTRRDSNNQTNVHPLPLPPTVSTASQPAPSPKVAAKSEIGKSHWQKGKLIGRGTFGSVYVGSNRETGALCAMKEVELLPDDPKAAECIRQLEQEIQVLRQLKHPNIVQYYGSQTVGDRFYIYLEYVHPGSIVNYIRDHCEAITESVVRNFTRHILSGLAYLHSTKTIHRDIKGANLLVDAYGVVKLADFGMAKHLNGQAANLSLKGSPYWMAPELLQPDMQKDTDPDLALAVDIWSLGCTIIEMMNGKPPWSEYEGPAAMFKVLKETPRIPETLSPEGKDFLQCCFRRNPVERPTASMLLEHRFMKNSQQDRAHHEAGHPIHKHDNVQVSTGAESTKRKVSNSETVRKHRSEVAELKVPPRQPISSTLDALLTSSPSGFGHNMDHPSPSSAAPIPIKQVGRIYRSQ